MSSSNTISAFKIKNTVLHRFREKCLEMAKESLTIFCLAICLTTIVVFIEVTS
jgi:hypothetical protein